MGTTDRRGVARVAIGAVHELRGVPIVDESIGVDIRVLSGCLHRMEGDIVRIELQRLIFGGAS